LLAEKQRGQVSGHDDASLRRHATSPRAGPRHIVRINAWRLSSPQPLWGASAILERAETLPDQRDAVKDYFHIIGIISSATFYRIEDCRDRAVLTPLVLVPLRTPFQGIIGEFSVGWDYTADSFSAPVRRAHPEFHIEQEA
jgi:hypothetical protein